MRRIALVLTGAVMMAVMLTINVSTALSVPQGSMDTSFGNSGNVTTDFGGGEDNARGIAIQPDGKLVTAGSAEDRSGPGWANDFALARYNSDGSLDTSFGNGGKVTTARGGGGSSKRCLWKVGRRQGRGPRLWMGWAGWPPNSATSIGLRLPPQRV